MPILDRLIEDLRAAMRDARESAGIKTASPSTISAVNAVHQPSSDLVARGWSIKKFVPSIPD